MKVVYFGNNLFSSCLKYLLDEEHQILRVYKNSSAHDSSIIDKLCEKNDITICEHKPELSELNDLISLGAEIFIIAEYAYLVPTTNVKYAINIHPTLLPDGRGPTPLPYLIKMPEFSGVTIHKISNNFDSGDMILQAKVLQSANESITTLMIKMHLESARLLKIFINNISKYYKSARPQINHSYWSKVEMSERVLDWNAPINEIEIQQRCFGHIGLIIKLDHALWITSHLEFINYQHTSLPGDVAFEDDSLLAINALDGIVCIHKRSIFAMPV
ncbi:methionyl-tRNA formyltransferase [Colwellia sp. 6M3]|jgi:methionyl-tRNA formyltransferase|uniref:formyltransferase family protein n=1 Tax=Colwellia sp. 6M3 TaxID=2759849 RepID=UPI0015F777B4|nr:formyltransferase family protein [Colwellia sp. 6M3]MBA6415606.1 methionyl-tRNA formyltransferase [Colwellia sp. 6M3]